MFKIISDRTKSKNINEEIRVANELHNEIHDIYVLYDENNERIFIPDEVIVADDEDEPSEDGKNDYIINNYLLVEVNHKLQMIRLVKRAAIFDELYPEEINKGIIEAHPFEYGHLFKELNIFLNQLKLNFNLDYQVFIYEID